MRKRTFIQMTLVLILGSALPVCLRGAPELSAQSKTFEDGLAATLARFHGRLDIYTDAYAAGNHFAARGRLFARPGNEAAASAALPPMDEAFRFPGRPGTCIRASFRAARSNEWGGWYFLNGSLRGDERAPRDNWGDEPYAGVDLRGATRLTFLAAGAKGGERVEFFAFGVGRDADTGQPIKPHPDRSTKASTGYVTLTTSFQEFSIDLRGRDLRYVLGGFGWVANAAQNRGREIVFYLDDIRYDKARSTEPRFPLSFETVDMDSDFDRVMRNVSFTYDAAVALVAFVAAGDLANARLIADALVAAQNYDRFYSDGRLRNAYQAGDLFLSAGWTPNGRTRTVRMPGWYGIDTRDGTLKWLEDEFQVSTHTGNLAWAMLGLLSHYEATEGVLGEVDRQRYLNSVIQLGAWIETNCKHPGAGYSGGFNGWEPSPTKLGYRATEHNIDLVSAFERLSRATGDPQWLDRAEHARRFVESMWDTRDGKFWTGTIGAGDEVNKSPVPLDVQAWSVLALGERGKPYRAALVYAEKYLQTADGFAFSNADLSGTWYEGVAQMVVAYRMTGRSQEADRLVNVIRSARLGSGAVPAASKERLDTGFESVPGQRWFYYRRAHTGATAWAALAERGVNPFAPIRPLPTR